jgi:hypothetical protein
VTTTVAPASNRAAAWRVLADARGCRPGERRDAAMDNAIDCSALSVTAPVARELGEPSGRWLRR